MTCESREGVCSKCFGKREHGGDSAVGDNLGAISSQSMSEPATQMTMRTFHTGGVAEGGIGANLKTGFARVIQMTELPSVIRGSATLSETAGIVRSIDVAPAGGWNIMVEGEDHYVPATNKVAVQVGDRVTPGQKLSSGDENPHEILRLRGMKSTQNFLSREIRDEYKNQGINLRPAIVETAVRQLTNLTRITDPGDSDYAPGDYAPMSKVNAEVRGGANIQHEPELKGINQQPLFGNEDWLSQLNFQNLKRTIVNASSKGWSSSIHGTNPIAAWVYGAEFGKSKEPGRY
jgi:DNA-directed RNA polymerase subunit beta'